MEPATACASTNTSPRAAQKLNLSSPHRRKRHSSSEEDFSGFCGGLHRHPPPFPPALLRRIGVREVTGIGKVKVMLRVNGSLPSGESLAFLSVDSRRKQVTLVDPTVPTASEDRRLGVAAPKMFAFDAVFTRDDSQTEISSAALTDVIHAVINGTDGCVFCFGHARLGKTQSMVGSADSPSAMGAMPCAISWLFRGIGEQKQKTGARFSVRVSAVEVCGPAHQLTDLLSGHASDCDQSPGVYLRDDPLFGTQLQHQSELRASSPEKAAFYLDAAVAARSSESHFLYTLHVYQYNVAGKGGVAGGRSRLHLIDLGSCEKGKASGGIPLSGLGNVLLAIFNGQKHLPYREHKVTQLLKECLSSLTCHATMIAHVSPLAQNYTDTLATIQLASRIHRMRRRKIKFVGGTSTGSGGSSGDETRPQTHENGHSTGSSDIDPSSSEQSADTVIYIGRSDDATDGEHPPVYIPSLNSGDNRCAMGKALRGSGAEHKSTSPAKQKMPNGLVIEDKGSPSHRSGRMVQQPPHSSSRIPASSHGALKSSPARTTKCGSTKAGPGDNPQPPGLSSKIPVPYGCPNGPIVSGSDEQWIDGPRISKSRVVEARNHLKENGRKKETWVDGPLQAAKTTAHAAGYGFMDNHKKSMIQKWVENQTTQIQKLPGGKHEPRPLVTGAPTQPAFKELTAFKTASCEEVGSPAVQHSREQTAVNTPSSDVHEGKHDGDDDDHTSAVREECQVQNSSLRGGANGLVEENQLKVISFDNIVEKEERNDNIEGEEDNTIEGKAPFSKTLQPHNKEISIDVLTNNFDVRLRILEDNHHNGDKIRESQLAVNGEARHGEGEELDVEKREADDGGNFNIDELGMNDVEIIEVEEPLEPVPMQDCCLQVTEEDIALCMAGLDGSFPNIDLENEDEHPLRILSQENLTVVSTFTDSLSVATDLERNFPRHQFHQTPNHSNFSSQRPYSLHELNGDYVESQNRLWLLEPGNVPKRQVNGDDIHYRDQLAKLHETYRSKLAQVGSSRSSLLPSHCRQQPSRCQSLSLNDMLYGSEYGDVSPKADPGYGACRDNSSIYSEPVYSHLRQEKPPEAKICDNCKKSLNPAGTSVKLWYQPLFSGSRDRLLALPKGVHTSLCGRNGHRFCTKLTGSSYNISSLRHPDGASNPDLKEEVKRVPGNGSSASDRDREMEMKSAHGHALQSEQRTVTGKENDEEDDDEPPPALPPPLPTRLPSRLFGRPAGGNLIGYDSGHESGSPRPIKVGPPLLGRPGHCESSGYESFPRDSECSSLGSSHEFSPGVSASRGSMDDSKKVAVLQYCREDVERLERRWSEARGGRIRQLKQQQQELKDELQAAKNRLLIPASRWSFELHVEGSMDQREPSFVEALERETIILRKRVEVCKSRVLLVTCFDSAAKHPPHD